MTPFMAHLYGEGDPPPLRAPFERVSPSLSVSVSVATAQTINNAPALFDEPDLMRRVILRLMPLVTIIYLIAIIDRANIGFAELQMTQDLHMSEAVYGLG
jgi:hypothetical protein